MLSRGVSVQWIEEELTRKSMNQRESIAFPEDPEHAVFCRQRDGQWTAWRALMTESCATEEEATERCHELGREAGIRFFVSLEPRTDPEA